MIERENRQSLEKRNRGEQGADGGDDDDDDARGIASSNDDKDSSETIHGGSVLTLEGLQ